MIVLIDDGYSNGRYSNGCCAGKSTKSFSVSRLYILIFFGISGNQKSILLIDRSGLMESIKSDMEGVLCKHYRW